MGGKMLYCSVHQQIYVGTIQKWIEFPERDLLSLQEEILEGACAECVSVAKETIRLQFPDLFDNIPSVDKPNNELKMHL
jgi:hypothetical protein